MATCPKSSLLLLLRHKGRIHLHLPHHLTHIWACTVCRRHHARETTHWEHLVSHEWCLHATIGHWEARLWWLHTHRRHSSVHLRAWILLLWCGVSIFSRYSALARLATNLFLIHHLNLLQLHEGLLLDQHTNLGVGGLAQLLQFDHITALS